MPSPDLSAPDRLEELMGGAVPEGAHEARVQGLARELRIGGTSAPASLRERVAALGDDGPRRRAALLRRRPALAVALVLVAVAGVGAGIDRRDRRIEQLGRAIRIGQLRFESGTLDPEERLLLQIRLERQRATRADLWRANTRDRREAATSELTLLLHTREAPVAAEKDEGEAAGAARDALRLLGDIAVVALFLAIVLAPLLLLAVLVWLALRSRSRRLETRLLDRPEPAGPQSPRG